MNRSITGDLIITGSLVAGAVILYQVFFTVLNKWGSKRQKVLPSVFRSKLYYPGLFAMTVVVLWIALSFAAKIKRFEHFTSYRHAVIIAGIAAFAILLTRVISVAGIIALKRYDAENPLDYSLRKAKTKFHLIERIISFIVFIAATSVILMTFKEIRQLGSTLLASAGLLGLIVGFAAQKSLGTLFAGIQIAIAQPIRIDDTVVVEEQFGTIGEITLTYVVVNTWDGRRLVVPINYFLERPFENWTRVSPEVIGKVIIHADYALPVSEIRPLLLQWLADTELWDGRVSGLAITGAKEHTIELRAIMSARNSADAYALECLIREKLIAHIRETYPHCLPRRRVIIAQADSERRI